MTSPRVLTTTIAVTAAIIAASPAGAEVIRQIDVTGAERIGPESIRDHLTLHVGDPYEAAKASASLHALHATGLFKDVRIERQGARLVVRVVERPVVAHVGFRGNQELQRSQLEAVVRLKPGTAYSQAAAHADALRIRDLYRDKGRLGTTVEPKPQTLPDHRIGIDFVVTEGPVLKVESITFEGNHTFSARELKGVMRTAESSWLDILKDNATYRPDALELDRELIRHFYRRKGFPDASVAPPMARANAAGDAYAVTFRIDEGVRATLSGARIESRLPGADVSGLAGLVATPSGAFYDAEAVASGTEKLTLALADRGQASARVTPHIERHDGGRRVEIVYRLEPGARLTIEHIDIRGNTKTRDFVIRRELRLADGDTFNPLLVERDRRRILKLGFFKSVAIEPAVGSAPDRVKLTVAVIEQESADLSYGLGYSWNEGVIADIAVADSNLFGTGDAARLKVAGSHSRLEAEASYTRPHFLDTSITAGFDVFYKDQDLSTQSSYMSRRMGTGVRFSDAIDDNWTASVGYTFSRNTLYNVGDAASLAIKEALPGYPATTSATTYTSSVGTTISYDSRNAKKLPTSGGYFATSQDFAGLGGDSRFIRLTGDGRYYYPIGDVTLIARATGGVIGGWGGEDVRLLDLFYKGGDMVRGFAPGGIGPRDTLSANQDALGGKTYVSTTAEARLPLPFVPDDMGLKGAVFADAGSLFGASKTAAALPGVTGSAPALRASVGAGLVWDSPLGPLRADYAIPLAKQTFDKSQPWSFGLAAY
jgi:outer membrane protein insertion porin family